MSDLGKYELDDIVWESSDFDDHIVPYAGVKKIGYAVARDSFNRPRTELKCPGSNADSGLVLDDVTGRKGDASSTAVSEDKKTMLEKSPWNHSCNRGIPASLDGDAKRKKLCSVSDERRMSCLRKNVKSTSNEFRADDPHLGHEAFSVENNLTQYLLNDANRTENDLAFLGNGIKDENSDDLLFYGWPELENLEDIDNMLRDCDPTFSLDIDNSDDLGWFSASQPVEGSNNALKSGFDFSGCHSCGLPSVTEQQEVYGQSNDGMVLNESNEKLTVPRLESDSQKLLPDKCSTIRESYADESGVVHHVDSQSQINLHVSPSNPPKSSEGNRNNCSSENGVTFIQFDNLNEVGEANPPLNSQHNFIPENHQQKEVNHQPCLQTPKMVIKSSSHPHVLPSPTPSTTKSEVGVCSTITPVESSHASNQMKSVDSSRVASFKIHARSENKKKAKLHQRKLSRHAEKSNLRAQRVGSDLYYTKKAIFSGENEGEGQSKVNNCKIGFSGEVDSSNTQEGSSMSSVLGEVAVDASSLKQLQQVMGQLDIRTKLCIRDSLYRLARSAAQRHQCDNQSGGGADYKDATGAPLSGTNKCTGFIDMETDTNHIDRSIAHLLFHRPTDRSVSAVAVKSNMMVEAPNPLESDKPVCRETILVNEDAFKQSN